MRWRGVVQAAVNVGGVDRLTDTSKYTGSHKERFDESGKGKGISGREEVKDNTGYVGAYKGAGTYDKTHWVNPSVACRIASAPTVEQHQLNYPQILVNVKTYSKKR